MSRHIETSLMFIRLEDLRPGLWPCNQQGYRPGCKYPEWSGATRAVRIRCLPGQAGRTIRNPQNHDTAGARESAV